MKNAKHGEMRLSLFVSCVIFVSDAKRESVELFTTARTPCFARQRIASFAVLSFLFLSKHQFYYHIMIIILPIRDETINCVEYLARPPDDLFKKFGKGCFTSE